MKTIILLSLLSFPVYGDWTVHTVSDHLNQEGLNNINPGLGYDFNNIRVGGLYNSYKRPSFYVAGIADISPSFRVGAGLISGYQFKDNDIARGDHASIIPFIAAEYDITNRVSIVWFGDVLNLELKF